MYNKNTLWLFNIAMEMALIEIDGLPFSKIMIFRGYVKKPDGNYIYIYHYISIESGKIYHYISI